jgi:hypothetical protein
MAIGWGPCQAGESAEPSAGKDSRGKEQEGACH